ncbi:uncharacterized protein B0I36DRAFT_46755 [Microdochium trichocladiopsis]|uniref:Uncharacterized protein n=1 Tax=Microdochium trichocladiopsis TaxID=1682393 RepID=A0A9P8XTI8_9PEZI|nr:uncharacterized protein B0I36DRAFT_46755 [Microdochium trichocladiopsis]KAH7016485.1 hypothetical protein B0I36DRAFT_46755 [Microdochium trichocladiopsis]
MADILHFEPTASLKELAGVAYQNCQNWRQDHHDPKQVNKSNLYKCDITTDHEEFVLAFLKQHRDHYVKWRVTYSPYMRGPYELRSGRVRFVQSNLTILPLGCDSNYGVKSRVLCEVEGTESVLDWVAGSGILIPVPFILSFSGGRLAFLVLELVPISQ